MRFLDEEDNSSVSFIQKFFDNRPIPQKFALEESREKQLRSSGSLDANGEVVGIIEEIENMQQFYSWYEELEEDKVEEERYSSRIGTLKFYRDHCDNILSGIHSSLSHLQELEDKYKLVARKTGELHQACELLVQDQQQLVLLADNLEKKLAYFNELSYITSKLTSSTLVVYEESFKSVLVKLDECIDFISKHRDFKDSDSYLLKYKQLQNRGLSLIKNEIVQVLKNTTSQIIIQIKETTEAAGNKDGTNVPASLPSDTYFYVKFRTIAPKLRPLCEEIEKRSNTREYAVLLGDCQNCYFQQRRLLLANYIEANIAMMCQTEPDLCNMTRGGCVYLMGVCHNEYQLYQHFFGSVNNGLTTLLEGFASTLYYNFRPTYIRSHNIEMLCQLVYLLRTEIIAEQLDMKGPSVESFRPIVLRMLQDVQERLTFLVQTFIRDEIAGYQPTDADLDYPKRLYELDKKPEDLADDLQMSNTSNDSMSTLMPFKSAYKSWYPTLERTLVCLSKLYLTVDTRIFEGLATDAVDSCTLTLVVASRLISVKSPFDGLLFLVKHLLILREQITPFDISFSITEQSLDFNYLRNVLRQIIAVPGTVFTFTTQNPLFAVVNPPIEVLQIDSKKELEKGLKGAIENFILYTVKVSMEPLISFLTKASAFLNSSREVSLRTQAFASPDNINLMLRDLERGFDERLEPILGKLREYIPNTSTQSILYKPITDQMVDSLDQLRKLVNTQYLPDDRQLIDRPFIDRLSDSIKKRLSGGGSSLSSAPTTTNTTNTNNNNNNDVTVNNYIDSSVEYTGPTDVDVINSEVVSVNDKNNNSNVESVSNGTVYPSLNQVIENSGHLTMNGIQSVVKEEVPQFVTSVQQQEVAPQSSPYQQQQPMLQQPPQDQHFV